MQELIITPKGWVETFGELVKFIAQVFREIFGLRVFRFFGEALRQAGILIVGSAIIVLGLVFIDDPLRESVMRVRKLRLP